jgi:hypothetical protein
VYDLKIMTSPKNSIQRINSKNIDFFDNFLIIKVGIKVGQQGFWHHGFKLETRSKISKR